jgi:hypothetical protein
MRKQILPYEETRRNSRIKELLDIKRNNLLVTGTTGQLEHWNVDEIIPIIRNREDRERITQYDFDNTECKYCEDMTYLEREQFDNTYNNF